MLWYNSFIFSELLKFYLFEQEWGNSNWIYLFIHHILWWPHVPHCAGLHSIFSSNTASRKFEPCPAFYFLWCKLYFKPQVQWNTWQQPLHVQTSTADNDRQLIAAHFDIVSDSIFRLSLVLLQSRLASEPHCEGKCLTKVLSLCFTNTIRWWDCWSPMCFYLV